MDTLIIIGGGNMGAAIARAALARGVRVHVAEPDPVRRADAGTHGCTVFAGAGEALRSSPPGAALVLAVKPQNFGAAAAELGPCGDRLVVSIMAGVSTARIAVAFRGSPVRIVRAMPNLPLTLGLGMTALTPGERACGQDIEAARDLFPGETIEIPEELMDAFTALAGSGPAYLFYLAEAMERAGVEIGFTSERARLIARQTIIGAAAMIRDSHESPDALRARVTSKGGTTAAATAVLDGAGVMEAFARAIIAARDRGRTL